jgi:hypothetical protein
LLGFLAKLWIAKDIGGVSFLRDYLVLLINGFVFLSVFRERDGSGALF